MENNTSFESHFNTSIESNLQKKNSLFESSFERNFCLENSYSEDSGNSFCLNQSINPQFFNSIKNDDFSGINQIKISQENNSNVKNKKKNILGKKKDEEKKEKERKHDKYSKDNIKRKIQVHYFKFLTNFLNQIIKEVLNIQKNNKNIKFFPLNYNFKKNITKSSFDSLKMTTLGDIFKNNISPRYKNSNNLNIFFYDEITNKNDILKNILDKTYLEFFDIYYLNRTKINLANYGLKNKTIILSSNISFYKDLLKSNDEINYLKKIEKCIKSDFLPFLPPDKPIFLVY